MDLNEPMVAIVEHLLQEFNDVFAWTYKDLKRIPLHIVVHSMEFDTTISPTHQAKYQMNPNYIAIMKQDLDKLLATGFIAPIEETSWLSSIIVVPKKEWKDMHLCGFLTIERHHKERPTPPTIYRRGLGYGGNTWDVLCFQWIFRSKHVKKSKCDQGNLHCLGRTD